MKIAVGLSGGVDSALAAALLKEQGHEVVGVYLDCFEGERCGTSENKRDAIQVAMDLGVKIKILDLKKAYSKKVIKYMVKEYKQGRTPNPDVVCNREIKFGLMADWVFENGFDKIATGHYARIEDGQLMRAKDEEKDQSYFLWDINQKILDRVVFPIGNLKKKEVRMQAKKRRIKVWNKRGSRGVCMVGKMDLKEFLKSQGVKERQGKVVSKDEIIGEHKGVEFYTVGQRHGFTTNKPGPWFVIGKGKKKNELVVGKREELYSDNIKLLEVKYRGKKAGLKNSWVRIRHRGELVKVIEVNDGIIRLEKKVFGLAPGQVVVFYDDGGLVLAGGVIK